MREFDLSSALLQKQRLLQEGKSDLLFSRLSVKETAYRLHFFEPNHLMRFFKRETGKTFTQYLRDYQNGIYEWKRTDWKACRLAIPIPKMFSTIYKYA